MFQQSLFVRLGRALPYKRVDRIIRTERIQLIRLILVVADSATFCL
jgi:hypothetical protein